MSSFFLHANIEVIYDGRASSTLERGDYVVIKKPDNSIQILARDQIQPRNYMTKVLETVSLLLMKFRANIKYNRINFAKRNSIETTTTNRNTAKLAPIICCCGRWWGFQLKWKSSDQPNSL